MLWNEMIMNALLIILPFLLVVGALAYGLLRALIQLWANHRVKVVLLERAEQYPQLLESPDALRTLLTGLSTNAGAYSRLDYALTGVFLMVIGLVCIAMGRLARVGVLAVGTYLGGVICVGLGMVLTVLGLVIRRLARAHPGGAEATTRNHHPV